MKGEAKGREEIEEMRMAMGNAGGGVERRRVKGTGHGKRRETKRETEEGKNKERRKEVAMEKETQLQRYQYVEV